MRMQILDGNCFIHIGEAGFSKDWSVGGVPTGGIYHLMCQVLTAFRNSEDCRIVFDSPSFRKEISDGYKSNRKSNSKIITQIQAIKPFLQEMGVQVYQVPGYEGDDLIANIIRHCVWSQNDVYGARDAEMRGIPYFKEKPKEDVLADIYSADYDLLMNVSNKTVFRGANSNVVTVDMDNFNTVVRNIKTFNTEVPYNTIGLYKVCFGDKSDCYSGVGEEAHKLWGYLKFLYERDYVSVGEARPVDKDLAITMLTTLQTLVKPETYQRALVNVDIVYPKYLTPDEMRMNGIDFNIRSPLGDERDLARRKKFANAFCKTCRIFRLKSLYRKITGGAVLPEASEQEKQYLKHIKQSYDLDYFAYQDGVDPNNEVAYNGSEEVVEKNHLTGNTTWDSAIAGGNVGLDD